MGTLLIHNGRILDPARNRDEVGDLWIVDGRFAPDQSGADRADETIDATGMFVMPGLVDVHVHLREPGNEAAETIESGCAAALAGGFTSIVCMPNTTPALDTPARLSRVLEKAKAVKGPRVYAMGAITMGREGRRLADLAALAGAGAVGFTDDGNGVQDRELILQALQVAGPLRKPIVEHCEDGSFSGQGVMHDGPAARRVGLAGIPAVAESAMVERDITLSERAGARLHVQHVSAAESVELIRAARVRGLRVTAEATPHHLTLKDEDAADGGTNFKMNPPLRSERDRAALIEAVCDGTISVIATDHAPHSAASKSRSFREAPFGVIGMETALGVMWTQLVRKNILTPLQLAARMSRTPAAISGLRAGILKAGAPADVTIFDPARHWKVDANRFRSKSRNCPFTGWELQGRVAATIVGGEVRYRDDLH